MSTLWFFQPYYCMPPSRISLSKTINLIEWVNHGTHIHM